MEVYQTETHFIIVDKQHSLWCSRIDGSLQPRTGEVSLPVSALCIGMVHGVVGKFKTRADSDWKLIVIKTQRKAGCILETHDIFQINKVAIISLSGTEPTDLGLSPCPDHHGSFHKDKMAACGMHSPSNSSKPLQKTWNSVMSAVENVKPKKSFLTDLCNIVQPERDSGFQKEVKDKEKFERRIYEELLKLFNETNSFYYSLTFDLTNTVQRQSDTATAANATAANEERNNGGSGGGGKGTSAAAAAAAGVDVDVDGGAASKETAGSMGSTAAPPPPQPPSPPPLWKVADERFFWNHYLLKELLDLKDEAADHWIVPVIQGFVQDELCLMEFDINKSLTPTGTVVFDATQFRKDPLKFWLTIISRRSRHRAGTRSKKRGLEESGACANYVETEQIIQFPPHLVSFVQVRGSIPVYWSQSGFKYRPPPRLEKG
ncbi:phosphatidylinositide phosphatase SAC2-like, partial [Argonauta hians]